MIKSIWSHSGVLLLPLFVTLLSTAYAKVLIISHVYNQPLFLDWQCQCFQKFLQDDYELVIFNDARPGKIHDELVEVCEKWGIRCIPIPQEIHNHPQKDSFWQNDPHATGSKRHVDGIQYSLDLLGYDHDGIVAFFDSDLFLIKPFSIEQALANHDIVSLIRGPLILNGNGPIFTHLWPGLTLLAMNRLPNRKTLDFKCGRINGHIVDTGGYTYYYLQENQDVRFFSLGTFMSNMYCEHQNKYFYERIKLFKNMGFDKEIPWLLKHRTTRLEFYFFNHFIHYGNGHDYSGTDKMTALSELLEQVLNE